MVRVDPAKLGGLFLCGECAGFVAPGDGATSTCPGCLEVYAVERPA